MFGKIEGNLDDVVDNPLKTRDYTIMVGFKKGTQRVLQGTYNKWSASQRKMSLYRLNAQSILSTNAQMRILPRQKSKPFNYSKIRTPQVLNSSVPPGFGTAEINN